jgi:hypothetical protein
VYAYDTSTGTLYSVATTQGDEILNDVSVAGDTATVVWSVQDPQNGYNVYARSFTLDRHPRPVANDDHYSVPTGKPLVVGAPGVLGNDVFAGTATATRTSQPADGAISAWVGDGSFAYQPAKGFVGTDTFTYTVRAGGLTSSPATVTLAVTQKGADCNLADYPNVPGSTALNLKGATLGGCYLAGADLEAAVAANASLRGADLAGANLSGADLTQANLAGAVLTNADLVGSNLSGANLAGASMVGADVNGVHWSNTTCPDGTSSNDDGGTCAGHLG